MLPKYWATSPTQSPITVEFFISFQFSDLYFLVDLWILWSKFKPIGNSCFVTDYFRFSGTANLGFEVIGLSIWRSGTSQPRPNRSELYCPTVLWLALLFLMQPCHVRFRSTINTRSGFCLQYTYKFFSSVAVTSLIVPAQLDIFYIKILIR